MREIKPVKVGNCILDGKHIYIQSMLNTRSDDIAGSVAQAVALEQAGCEIVRAAIPNHEAIALIPAINPCAAASSYPDVPLNCPAPYKPSTFKNSKEAFKSSGSIQSYSIA